MEMLPQPIFSSTFVCIITIFSILPFLPPSYSDRLDEFIECSRSASFECGRLGTFHYPFWNDDTPEYCRPLGFYLKDCEGVPTIEFGPDSSFLLQHVNPSDYNKLTIAPMNLQSLICSETAHHGTLLPSFFKFSETNKNFSLFYDCLPPPCEPPGIRIADCGPNGTFYTNDSKLEGYDDCECDSVEVEVNQTIFNKVHNGELTLVDALNQFCFDVEYSCSAVFCDQYEELGGKCVNNSTSDQYLREACLHHPGMDYLCKTICF
ncbi:hypothetical protein SLEP1_g47232 [Rubroshorea leprosula]|uniref:Uncharacterized protein n=1 Tax=Rubroshorea leprosula TaxID=152421 RepID=A0AAV5LRJ2_9ROSI|nr:hypothetical protein SLEP1_g47232 [Rubroshorea leprosula]